MYVHIVQKQGRNQPEFPLLIHVSITFWNNCFVRKKEKYREKQQSITFEKLELDDLLHFAWIITKTIEIEK